MERTCKKCGENKQLDEFYKNKHSKDGHLNICKKCSNEYYKLHPRKKYSNEYYKLHPRKKYKYKYISKWNPNIHYEKKSGIYKLRSILFPDKFYIGSSGNLHKRKLAHKYKLQTITSAHYKLQSHVNIYGYDDLVFIILKICPINELIYWEQYYISELNPCFNGHKFASRMEGGDLAKLKAYNDISEYKNGYVLVPFEHLVRSICDRDLFPEIIIPI